MPAFSVSEWQERIKIMLQMLVANGEILFELLGIVGAFILTKIITNSLQNVLPADQGREFAHDGSLSRGKPRGAGIIFVLVFVFCVGLCGRLNAEIIIYLVLMTLAMLTGFLDDAAKNPWGEYKKGFLDFVIAALVAVTYLHFNGNVIRIALFNQQVEINKAIFVLLAIILVWVSINVTNCTDGVDGLSASLVIVTLVSIYSVFHILGVKDDAIYMIPVFVSGLLAYLWYNATPSKLLMGDAGSRAMGLLISIMILKTGSPLLYIPLAIVLIVDGGIGLIKVSLKRFFKISILKNTITPLHDHVRKNKGWSNTHVVFRFVIIQVMVSFVMCYLLKL